MSSADRGGSDASDRNTPIQDGWEAALLELQHQASHLEARGSRAAVTLYDAIRIARAGGLICEHRTRI